MFARAALRAGTPQYAAYYERRPDLQATDDHLRAMPELGQPGGRHYHEAVCRETEALFAAIPAVTPSPATVDSLAARVRAASAPTGMLKELTLELGAVAVGCAPLPAAFVYTHKGRFPRDQGCPVPLDHQHAIVFLVEMDHAAMQQAPRTPCLRESARQYLRAAQISRTLEAVLRRLEHGARSQHDAHYEVILPPLAVLAGLGEIGRNNILIADRYGSRVRIGAVTTDLPLEHDRPVSLGAAHFCELCRKCAACCPSHALSDGPRETVRGVSRYTTHVERCYGYWRQMGTDCGICMACCPFSHRTTALHGAVRWMVRRLSWTHRLALWCDDLLYGRQWPPRRVQG
jgi:hypothetical protein